MKVSVIIPAYNEESSISDCLSSLLKQRVEDLEIVVVDDGSDDHTREVVSKFPVKLVNGEHKGAGSARNLGVRNSSGEILVFVDADMTFDEDFVEKLIEPIKSGNAIGTFSIDEYVSNKDNVWAQCWNINRGLPIDRMHGENYPKTQPVFRAIKKESFLASGGFDEDAGYTDDWTISKKLGVQAVVTSGARYCHKNPSSLREVFVQSRWMAKREYKFGLVGYAFAVLRRLFPVSVVVGIVKGIINKRIQFPIFKVVSDFGELLGIIEFAVLKKVSK